MGRGDIDEGKEFDAEDLELWCKDLMFYAEKTMHGFAALWEYFVFGFWLGGPLSCSIILFFFSFCQNCMVLNSYYSHSALSYV